jgi:hypothetical protein
MQTILRIEFPSFSLFNIMNSLPFLVLITTANIKIVQPTGIITSSTALSRSSATAAKINKNINNHKDGQLKQS